MKFTFSSTLIRQYAVVVIVNLGVVTTGMSLAWPSPMLVKLRNETVTPLARPITEEEGSWIVSGGYLLGIICNLLGGIMLDSIGRKCCLLLISIPKMAMSLLLIFATEVWMLIFARVILTITDCFLFVVVPIYASEIACKEHRGSLGSFMQIFSSIGIVITLAVGPFLSYKAFSIVFASAIALTTLPMLLLPDSPFFLYSKGHKEKAHKVLIQIRQNEAVAKQEIEEYELSNIKNEEKVDKATLLKNKTFLKCICLGLLLCGGSQIIGFNAVQFYLQTILESTKTSLRPELASVIIGIIQVFASFCTPLILTQCGRRPALITSLVGMFLGMLGLGVFFKISEPEGYVISGFMNFLPIISLILVIYCYSAGIGSLVWLVLAELFEGPGRAFGVSISSITTLSLIFLTTKYFVFMTTALGPAATYWFFSAMCVLVGTLIALFIPETKGKSFSEIQKSLRSDSMEFKEKS